MKSEYAVYVVDGSIRSVCPKRPDAQSGEGMIQLDQTVVQQAVNKLASYATTKSLKGYRADFAVIKKQESANGGEEVYKTGLVKVSDGYLAERQDDMPVKDFADMIILSFGSL